MKESFDPAAFWALYSGPLETGGTIAEFLALAYQNGMDLSTVVPGDEATDCVLSVFLDFLDFLDSALACFLLLGVSSGMW